MLINFILLLISYAERKSNVAFFTYFVLPINCHIFANSVLFILTAVYCSKVKAAIDNIKTDTEKENIKKSFFKKRSKYIKISINMKILKK